MVELVKIVKVLDMMMMEWKRLLNYWILLTVELVNIVQLLDMVTRGGVGEDC